MRRTKMLARALGVERAIIERVDEDAETSEFTLHVRPRKEDGQRCPICRVPCAGYDDGAGRRRWRTHDMGLMRAYVEADAPRVRCLEHGVKVAHVPWARPKSGFTKSFEDMVAWLAVRTDRTTLSTLVGIAWRTVGSILERVRAEGEAARDPLNGVRRIGIDEVSYRKGHRFLTVVVDHDTGHLLWAEAGRDEKTVRKFFRLLGKKRCKAIELVSADAAAWIGNVVRERCPNAKLCIDPFHVVAWATKALDEVRRGLWNKLRKKKEASDAKAVKGTRWALLKNPENLTRNQRRQLDAVEREHQPLFKAYLLKEQLREVFRTRDWQAPFMLNAWLERADESAIKPLKKVAAAIRTNLEGIYSALLHGLSNARLESANNKLRLLTRMAYGFHSHKPLIALAMLKLGGLCPPLPTARPPTG